MNFGERALTGNYRKHKNRVSINTLLRCLRKRLRGKGRGAMLATTVKSLCCTAKYVDAKLSGFESSKRFTKKLSFGFSTSLEALCECAFQIGEVI